MLFQMQHARRAGSRERDLDEREDRPSSRAESGRAIGNRDALPEQSGVPHGRASFHGGAAAQPHPSTSRPLVGAVASGGVGTKVGGRGASRFREQREPPVVTRPSADFNKSGK